MSTKRQTKDNRRYPKRPILGVGALIFRHGRILLVERGREPFKGYWSLPGGVLEVGETLEFGVAREVKEETGLEVTPVALVEIFERLILDQQGRPEYHYVLIDFLCRARPGKLAPASDVLRAEWVRLMDLADYRLTDGVLEAIGKALKLRKEMRKR
ncbi:MAG: NUDIX hydrolase [Acidobacteriota bacterium]